MPLLVKTSVTISRVDLAEARRLGINVSEVARTALAARLAEETLERQVVEYIEAFSEWDESPWDHLAGEGLSGDGDETR